MPSYPSFRPGALRLLSVAFAASSRASRAEAAAILPLFNKGVYDAAAKCARLGWFVRRRQFLKPSSSSADFLAQQGRDFELHVLQHARLAPNTVELPAHLPVAEAAAETRALMEQAVRDFRATGEATAVLQPTFVAGPLVARADAVVLAAPDGATGAGAEGAGGARGAASGGARDDASSFAWDVIEIKSVLATNANGKAADLAFTVHAAQASGVRVREALLYAVNPAFRLESAESVALFAAVNLTEPVRALVDRVLAPPAGAEASAGAAAALLPALLGEGAEAGAEAGGAAASAAVRDAAGASPGEAPEEEAEGEAALEAALALARLDLSVAALEGLTAQPGPAQPRVILGCKGCPAASACTAEGVSHPLWELPRIGARAFEALAEASPSLEVAAADGSGLTLPQRRFQAAVLRGDDAAVLADSPDELRRALRGLRLPFYYLDFEAAGLLFPPFDGLGPYENILTQYSIHRLDEAHVARAGGSVGAALRDACATLAKEQRPRGAAGAVAHVEYLADALRDCREELLVRLLDDLGEPADRTKAAGAAPARGSILVYSSYEATQLKRLAADFPHLAERALRARARLVDLEPLVRKCTSHALFRGRSSLKVALPTLAPHMASSYADDAIGSGGEAAAAYAELASGALAPEEAAAVRAQLLDYCALDTRAMVELHRALLALLPPDEASGALPARRAAAAAPAKPAEAELPAASLQREVGGLLVRELREELAALGLPRTGNKAELASRLSAARLGGGPAR